MELLLRFKEGTEVPDPRMVIFIICRFLCKSSRLLNEQFWGFNSTPGRSIVIKRPGKNFTERSSFLANRYAFCSKFAINYMAEQGKPAIVMPYATKRIWSKERSGENGWPFDQNSRTPQFLFKLDEAFQL
jgi:hypothetical protein